MRNLFDVIENVIVNRTRSCNKTFVRRPFVSMEILCCNSYKYNCTNSHVQEVINEALILYVLKYQHIINYLFILICVYNIHTYIYGFISIYLHGT